MILHGRARPRRLIWLLATFVLVGVLAPTAKAEAITICHSTGSPSAPWVFLTIDDSTWPEHQAHGDFRATSLAQCRTNSATTVPQQASLGPPMQQQPAATPTAQPTATPAVTATPVATRAATASATVVATAVPGAASVEVAGATVLPASGEPVMPVDPLLAGLVAVGAVGLALRMVGYLHRY